MSEWVNELSVRLRAIVCEKADGPLSHSSGGVILFNGADTKRRRQVSQYLIKPLSVLYQ